MKKKFKLKKYKFLFILKQRDNPWNIDAADNNDPVIIDYQFGNRFTDNLSQYKYYKYHIASYLRSELTEIDHPHATTHASKATFTESEATILLLRHFEDNLKESTKKKKTMDSYIKQSKMSLDSPHNGYHYKVHERSIRHNTEAVKIFREKVKKIKSSPEYMWEQLMK